MLDNLRDQASSSPIYNQGQPKPELPEKSKAPKARKPRRGLDKITGMTAPQRFFVAFMLFIMVFIFGSALLVLTGVVVIPGMTF